MGKRIKTRRKELKIKQSDLAERLDISNNHISAIENGREKPSMDLFVKICNELNVTPDYLLLGMLHMDDVPKNIIDGLRLCSEEDILLVEKFVDLLIERNNGSWNKDNYI